MLDAKFFFAGNDVATISSIILIEELRSCALNRNHITIETKTHVQSNFTAHSVQLFFEKIYRHSVRTFTSRNFSLTNHPQALYR
jgi:hypothetical protein